ncbi:hypothetical protein Pelo_2921 [Pelomyxa schiedti]|nr:hypothetical protein Pelo_2921 [Pelomyxa schiedti]
MAYASPQTRRGAAATATTTTTTINKAPCGRRVAAVAQAAQHRRALHPAVPGRLAPQHPVDAPPAVRLRRAPRREVAAVAAQQGQRDRAAARQPDQREHGVGRAEQPHGRLHRVHRAPRVARRGRQGVLEGRRRGRGVQPPRADHVVPHDTAQEQEALLLGNVHGLPPLLCFSLALPRKMADTNTNADATPTAPTTTTTAASAAAPSVVAATSASGEKSTVVSTTASSSPAQEEEEQKKVEEEQQKKTEAESQPLVSPFGHALPKPIQFKDLPEAPSSATRRGMGARGRGLAVPRHVATMASEDPSVRAQRAQRFGIPVQEPQSEIPHPRNRAPFPSPQRQPKQALADTVVAEDAERRRKRIERFGLPPDVGTNAKRPRTPEKQTDSKPVTIPQETNDNKTVPPTNTTQPANQTEETPKPAPSTTE